MTDTPTPRTQVPVRPQTREDKHHETMLRVKQSAVSLVLEHGCDNVTVDMICSRSGISQRTFFNYFNTKNAAIIGTESSTIDEPRMMLPGFFDTGRPTCSRMPWWASHVSWPCNRFPLRPAGPRLPSTAKLRPEPAPARARLTDKWLVPWPSRSTEPSSCTLHAGPAQPGGADRCRGHCSWSDSRGNHFKRATRSLARCSGRMR
ncbi:TetR family transcriptional regulator [Cryobacterium lyxosi]|uniref:TetR family transcriptional regulator n=1 Tax=Cryobacterium lyxosi TaxID=1259228 RepID=A0A4R8ZBQ4_9MICO|nr:TetR family transcriptional regulator [Cryobacterium lyxosi]